MAAATPRRFLAFDVGTRRTGVATGTTLLDEARPLLTLRADGPALLEAAARLVDEWSPDAIVVGVPFHPDGTPHAMTRTARRFAHTLRERVRRPVVEVDERWSTVEAARGADARGLDAAAAAVILTQHLRGLRDAT